MTIRQSLSTTLLQTTSLEDTRGSWWRKWDLHVHTPASFHWKGRSYRSCKSEAEQVELTKEVIKAINTSDVAVFGIMDYWTFDGYLKIREALSQNPELCQKRILPGIELRIEAPTNFRLNIHVLLSDSLSIQQISDFKSRLRIKDADKRNLSNEGLVEWAKKLDDSKASEQGFNPIQQLSEAELLELGSMTAEITNVSFESALDSLPKNSYVVILPYASYGGIAKLDWKKQPASDLYFMRIADIFESRDQEDIDIINGFKNEKNQGFIDNFIKTMGGKGKPVISGSDAHNISNYGVFPSDRITWIKADTTFNGLRQVLNEPRERVYIGEVPPMLTRVRNNQTMYIRSLEIRKEESSSLDEVWFDKRILFNHGLVAIIGNKGTGKSALVDILGLVAGYNKEEHFSFLNKKRFRSSRNNKAKHFNATLEWESNTTDVRNLDSIANASIEKVRYIPQNFFESICNETDIKEESNFDKELESVIFSHVPDHEKINFPSLRLLINYKTAEINRAIDGLNADMRMTNRQIVDLEAQLTEQFKLELEAELRRKQRELQIHDLNKPTEVEKPSNTSLISQEIDRLQEASDALKKEVETIDKLLEGMHQKLAIVDKIINNIIGFEITHNSFQRNLSDDLAYIDVDFNDIVKIEIDKNRLENLKESIQGEIVVYNDEISKKKLNIRIIEDEIIQRKRDLENIDKEYYKYVSDLRVWEERRNEIIGDSTTTDTILWHEDKLNQISTSIPIQLIDKKELRNKILIDIIKQKRKIKEIYEELYKPVQEFIHNHHIVKERYNLNFEVSLKLKKDFYEIFLSNFKRNVIGNFQNHDDGLNILKELYDSCNFDTNEDIIKFIESIVGLIEDDKRRSGRFDRNKQIKTDIYDVYNMLYGIEYISPDYALTLENKKLYQLSPGERGILLLIFYLLVDNNSYPLIIDQPEENIDNQSVFHLLVPCVKIAKEKRQIIMVTHNANLAVGCDAEQIIYANIDKENGNEIQYVCGSIENSTINRILVDVLEGTWPALSKRESMYHKNT